MNPKVDSTSRISNWIALGGLLVGALGLLGGWSVALRASSDETHRFEAELRSKVYTESIGAFYETFDLFSRNRDAINLLRQREGASPEAVAAAIAQVASMQRDEPFARLRGARAQVNLVGSEDARIAFSAGYDIALMNYVDLPRIENGVVVPNANVTPPRTPLDSNVLSVAIRDFVEAARADLVR